MAKAEVKYQRRLKKKYYYLDADKAEEFDDIVHEIETAEYQKKIAKQKIKSKFKPDQFDE